MIRFIARFVETYGDTHNPSDVDYICEKVLGIISDRLLEVWVKCPSPEKVFEFIEFMLNRGYTLLEVEFINNVRVRWNQLSLSRVLENGSYDLEVEPGLVTVRFYKKPSEWITRIPMKFCEIEIKRNIAKIHLSQPVKASVLFDNGLKPIDRGRGFKP